MGIDSFWWESRVQRHCQSKNLENELFSRMGKSQGNYERPWKVRGFWKLVATAVFRKYFSQGKKGVIYNILFYSILSSEIVQAYLLSLWVVPLKERHGSKVVCVCGGEGLPLKFQVIQLAMLTLCKELTLFHPEQSFANLRGIGLKQPLDLIRVWKAVNLSEKWGKFEVEDKLWPWSYCPWIGFIQY